MSLVLDEGRQKSIERHHPLTRFLHAKESQLQALHSEKRRSKAIEAATSLLPEQGQLPKRGGRLYSRAYR